ncbi:hypothetical protein B296_00035954 [Ensete ventricosum]|uniref:Uncharacterized protein n=1 Tax=Ensete ventricosum TaxID=4639 RepID=A0A427A434_ENSVE|nr:hypothetical protein B296_00035954 [Ensete ventricosum]
MPPSLLANSNLASGKDKTMSCSSGNPTQLPSTARICTTTDNHLAVSPATVTRFTLLRPIQRCPRRRWFGLRQTPS